MFQFQAIQTGQATITGTASQIVPQYSSRSGLTIVNTGSNTVYIGEAAVTSATGYPLLASASVSFSTTGAVFGVSSGGSTVGWLQTN
jgi:hypothetical protein